VIDTEDPEAYEYGDLDYRIADAYLRYYLHIQNPEKLSDEEWADRLLDLHFIRQAEKRASQS